MSGGGGSGSTTSTTVQNPTLEQQTLAKIQLGQAQDLQQFNDLARQVMIGSGSVASFNNLLPEFFPGETVAGFNPLQDEALGFTVDRARQLAQTAPQQFDEAIQFGTQGVFDQSSGLVNDAISRVTDNLSTNFLENVFPQIGSVAQQQGAFGGSRQGILEAQSTERLNRTIGDITSQMSLASFNRGLDTFDRTLAISPALQQASFLGADVLGRAGGLQQAQTQIELNADIDRFNFDQFKADDQLTRAASIQSLLLGGTGSIPGGGATTTSSTSGGGTGTGEKLLGGAASGAVVGAKIPGVGPVIGAGLGAVFSLF